jgi:hypothetical protein
MYSSRFAPEVEALLACSCSRLSQMLLAAFVK